MAQHKRSKSESDLTTRGQNRVEAKNQGGESKTKDTKRSEGRENKKCKASDVMRCDEEGELESMQ
jgi:hypothetical protein